MLKLATTGAIVLATVASAAHAAFDTGNSYWSRCSGKSDTICEATASAYLDMMQTVGYKCSTDGVSGQAKDVLLKFLADNPADRHWPVSTLAIVAFTKAFGCTKPEK